MITNMSLELERSIKARGTFKWCKEAIKCQKEYVILQHQLHQAKKQGNYENAKVIWKEIIKQRNNLEEILKSQSDAWLKQLKDQLENLPEEPETKKKRASIKNMI